jgi:hypothetical protein
MDAWLNNILVSLDMLANGLTETFFGTLSLVISIFFGWMIG